MIIQGGSYLNAEYAPNRLRGDFPRIGEDTLRLIHIPLHQLDFRGMFLCEFLGTAGRGVAGYGEDLDVGILGKESVDYASALLARGAGDEDGLGHFVLIVEFL